MKHNWKIFLASFCITIMVMGFFALLMLADKNTKEVSGMMDAETMFFFARTGEYTADVTLLNEDYVLDVSFVQQPIVYLERAAEGLRILGAPADGVLGGMMLLGREGFVELVKLGQSIHP